MIESVNNQFAVHDQLTNDCIVLGDLDLCRVLLMNDARFPWLILVPRLSNLRDLHDLPSDHAVVLFKEIHATSVAVQSFASGDKINVAALGNQVPQLHLHVIGRRKDDCAWPNPVWGSGAIEPYDSSVLSDTLQTFRTLLGLV